MDDSEATLRSVSETLCEVEEATLRFEFGDEEFWDAAEQLAELPDETREKPRAKVYCTATFCSWRTGRARHAGSWRRLTTRGWPAGIGEALEPAGVPEPGVGAGPLVGGMVDGW